MSGPLRILQLLDGSPDFQTERGAQALRRAGDGIEVIAHSIGAGGTHRNLASAMLGLRRAGRFDLIHAWGARAMTVAALAGPTPIIFSPTRFHTRRDAGWLRAVVGYRDVQTVCPTSTQRRVVVEAGIPVQRCHLIRPGVDSARVRKRRDLSLRKDLGLHPDDRVLLTAGESTLAANHELAVWVGSILNILDPHYKVLLWGRGTRIRRAVGLARRLGRPDLVRAAEPTLRRPINFEELTGAADAALITARGPVATLPIAVCMAAGLPIISTVTYTVAELLEDRHTAVLVPKPAPRLIARRVLELYDDATLQWSIADMARTEAYEFFAQTRFLNQFRTIYRQIAAREKVEVPEQPPGAGLRFHGRA